MAERHREAVMPGSMHPDPDWHLSLARLADLADRSPDAFEMRHLLVCRDCAAMRASFERTIRLVRGLAPATSLPVGAELSGCHCESWSGEPTSRAVAPCCGTRVRRPPPAGDVAPLVRRLAGRERPSGASLTH